MSNLSKSIIALSATGLIFIASHESFSSKPYMDSIGVWTDGFGNTHDVVPNKGTTVPKALAQLERNTNEAGQAVTRCVMAPINQHQYDAFVSFTFNVGSSAFCKSTLVKKFNAGDSVGACNELTKWVYASGKKLNGLVKRREAERQLCLN